MQRPCVRAAAAPVTSHRLAMSEPALHPQRRSRIVRWLLIGVGALSLLLGLIGIVVPLLPTVPFLLVTAACWSRASPRGYHWLLSRPRVGPAIERWECERYRARRDGRRWVWSRCRWASRSGWYVGTRECRGRWWVWQSSCCWRLHACRPCVTACADWIAWAPPVAVLRSRHAGDFLFAHGKINAHSRKTALLHCGIAATAGQVSRMCTEYSASWGRHWASVTARTIA